MPDPSPRDTRKSLAALGSDPDPPSADTPAAATTGLITATAARALRFITEEVRERAYQAANLSPDERAEWDRDRDHQRSLPDDAVIVANLKYKARPLDGIWASPPYLHNGSVPTLDALLSPVALRPGKVPLGGTLYDTEKVGYKEDTDPKAARFVLDTSLSGNYNTGHEFRDLTLIELEIFHKAFDFEPGKLGRGPLGPAHGAHDRGVREAHRGRAPSTAA